MLALQPFVDRYPPSADVQRADAELLARYADRVPASLLELWRDVGLGPYADGLISLINPDDYNEVLYGWLMLDEEDPTRVPIALSAFGHVFYYRKLTDEDEDVCHLDPHTSTRDVPAWSLDEFFNDYLIDEDSINEVLQAPLFREVIARQGLLGKGQMFAWMPALRLGGSEVVENLEKVNALVHLNFLLELAQQD